MSYCPALLSSLNESSQNVDDDARGPTRKLLAKWRPQVLQDSQIIMKPDIKEPSAASTPGPAPSSASPAADEMSRVIKTEASISAVTAAS